MNQEYRELFSLLRGFKKSPQQCNRFFESDCEIIKLKSSYLAVSVDSICEEISQGLYRDPFTWGWMSVMSSISDLAASGAKPVGMLLATEWKFSATPSIKKRFFEGAREALKDIPLLGGDSGSAREYFFSSTVIGESLQKPLMRTPVLEGDYVCVMEPRHLGAGPAFALSELFGYKDFKEEWYRPHPKPAPTALARASIDTSDGLANALHIVGSLNRVGFELTYDKRLMHPRALKFCQHHKIHPLVLWMGDLGDYQTLLFVPPAKIKKAIADGAVPLGRAVKMGFSVHYLEQSFELPIKILARSGRNLAEIKKNARKMVKYFGPT